MDNNTQPAGHALLQNINKPTEINLPGDNNTLIAHADNVNNEYNQVLIFSNQLSSGRNPGYTFSGFNTDFYNLIVVADGDLNDTNHFLVDKSRAITESTSPELKEAYAALTPEAIDCVKTFPTIIAEENHHYGKTDESQMAVYGMITDVKVQDNGIKVYYQPLNCVPQQKLNDLAKELGLGRAECFNELNRMHWAIKKINLVEVLRDNGIQVFSM